jgi:hypothetical protein
VLLLCLFVLLCIELSHRTGVTHSSFYKAEGLSPDQRIHILGQCAYLNILQWTLAQAPTSSSENSAPHTREHPGKPCWEHTYTFSQRLPDLREAHALSNGGTQQFSYSTTPPNPIPWTPRFLPEEWVYTDGSDITGHQRLGAAVVHTPTCTTIRIDATLGLRKMPTF